MMIVHLHSSASELTILFIKMLRQRQTDTLRFLHMFSSLRLSNFDIFISGLMNIPEVSAQI